MFHVRLFAPITIALILFAPKTRAHERLSQACMHAVAVATLTYGYLVANQLIGFDGTGELALAETDLSPAYRLERSKDKMLVSIDCAVTFIHVNNRDLEPSDVASCVK